MKNLLLRTTSLLALALMLATPTIKAAQAGGTCTLSGGTSCTCSAPTCAGQSGEIVDVGGDCTPLYYQSSGSFGPQMAVQSTLVVGGVLAAIGTVDLAGPLNVFGNSTFSGTPGIMQAATSGITFFVATSGTSDQRLKKDIQGLNAGLDDIMKLKPSSFRMIRDGDKGDTHYGFIAQDVQQVFPNLIHPVENMGKDHKPPKGEPETILTLEYDGLIAPTVKAVQELNTKLEATQAQNAKLQSEVEELRTAITKLQSAH